MRKEKPLPKESSFKEFADNKSKRPKTRTRAKKPRFQIKDSSESASNGNSRSRSSSQRTSGSSSRNNDSKGKSFSDFRSSSPRGGSSAGRDRAGVRGDRRTSDSRGSTPRGRSQSGDNYRGPNRTTSSGYSRSPRGNSLPDRRNGRGNSFKEDGRASRKSWDEIPMNKRGDERRSRGISKVELFDAVCKKCNKPCKVPFKPQMSKGVACSDCFDRNAKDNYKKSPGARFSDKSFSGRSPQKFARTNGGVKELFDAVCMKCKNPCKVPFKPTGKMGVSCSNCFVKKESPGRGRKTGGRGSFAKGRR